MGFSKVIHPVDAEPVSEHSKTLCQEVSCAHLDFAFSTERGKYFFCF